MIRWRTFAWIYSIQYVNQFHLVKCKQMHSRRLCALVSFQPITGIDDEVGPIIVLLGEANSKKSQLIQKLQFRFLFISYQDIPWKKEENYFFGFLTFFSFGTSRSVLCRDGVVIKLNLIRKNALFDFCIISRILARPWRQIKCMLILG